MCVNIAGFRIQLTGADGILFRDVFIYIVQLTIGVEFPVCTAGKLLPFRSSITRIPAVTDLPRGFTALEMTQKTDSINLVLHFYPGRLGNGRQYVTKIHNRPGGLTCFNSAGPADNKRHMVTCVGHTSFASFNNAAIHDARHTGGCSVITGENNKCLFSQPLLFNLGHDLTDDFIDIRHHLAEVLRLFLCLATAFPAFALGIPILGIWGWLKGPVRQNHGVVAKERLILIAFNKITQIVTCNIRAILARVINLLAIYFHAHIRIAGGSTGKLPKTIFIKAKLGRPLKATFQLPLADNASLVTGIFHHMTESSGLGIKQTKPDVVSLVIDPRHNLYTRRRADGLRITVVKAYAIRCEFIDVGGRIMILLAQLSFGVIILGNQVTISTHTFPAHVISHNDNDIGFISKKR